MLTADEEVFPNNAASLIVERMATIDSEIKIVQRALRDSDGQQAIGVFPMTWTPDENSFEMPAMPSQFAAGEPTLQRYIIGIQGMVLDSDEQRGIAIHSVLAKRIRALLYRDNPLAVGLSTLSVQMYGSTERIQRRGILTQRFLNNEVGNVFMFLSSCEYYLETETV